MPRFQVSGDVRHAFVHEIEADTLEQAQEKVEGMNYQKLDNVDNSQSATAIEVQDVEEIT